MSIKYVITYSCEGEPGVRIEDTIRTVESVLTSSFEDITSLISFQKVTHLPH